VLTLLVIPTVYAVMDGLVSRLRQPRHAEAAAGESGGAERRMSEQTS
jgi:hypothetical protein